MGDTADVVLYNILVIALSYFDFVTLSLHGSQSASDASGAATGPLNCVRVRARSRVVTIPIPNRGTERI